MVDYRTYNNALFTDFTIVPVGSHTQAAPGAGATSTLTCPTGASILLLQCNGAAGTDTVRYTIDGTAPTASVGFLLEPSDGVERLDLTAGCTVKVYHTALNSAIQYQWCMPFNVM